MRVVCTAATIDRAGDAGPACLGHVVFNNSCSYSDREMLVPRPLSSNSYRRVLPLTVTLPNENRSVSTPPVVRDTRQHS